MKRLTAAAPVLLLTAAFAGQSGPAIEAGQWEWSTDFTSIRIEGNPEMEQSMQEQVTAPPTVQTHCVTAEEAANPVASLAGARRDTGCVYTEALFADGRVRLRGVCPGPGGEGELRVSWIGSYTPTRMEGEFVTETKGTTPIRLTSTMAGRRVGACPDG